MCSQRRLLTKFLIVFIFSRLAFVAYTTSENEFMKSLGKDRQLLLSVTDVETIERSFLDFCAAWLAIAAFGTTLLFFIYHSIYAPFEDKLIAHINWLEHRLMMAQTQNRMLQYEGVLMQKKLTNFNQDSVNSANLINTLQQLLSEENQKNFKSQEQISSLEQDLTNATEAGLELHRHILQLLDTKKSEETLQNSVQSLHHQLHTHNQLMYEIKRHVSNKDNSDIQLALMTQLRRMNSDFTLIKELKTELSAEKLNFQKRTEEIRADSELKSLSQIRQNESLKQEILEVNVKYEMTHNELQISLAKIEILEGTIRTLKTDTKVKLSDLLNTVHVRAELLVKEKDYLAQQSHLVEALEANKQSDQNLRNAFEQVKNLNLELEALNKEKIEAQIGLSTLKSLFKDKETQMQMEIVEKSLTCLKQQDEIKELRSKILQLLKDAESQINVPFSTQHYAANRRQSLILPPTPFLLPYFGSMHRDVTPYSSRGSLASACTSESLSTSSSTNLAIGSEPGRAGKLQCPTRLRCKRQLFRKKSCTNDLSDA